MTNFKKGWYVRVARFPIHRSEGTAGRGTVGQILKIGGAAMFPDDLEIQFPAFIATAVKPHEVEFVAEGELPQQPSTPARKSKPSAPAWKAPVGIGLAVPLVMIVMCCVGVIGWWKHITHGLTGALWLGITTGVLVGATFLIAFITKSGTRARQIMVSVLTVLWVMTVTGWIIDWWLAGTYWIWASGAVGILSAIGVALTLAWVAGDRHATKLIFVDSARLSPLPSSEAWQGCGI